MYQLTYYCIVLNLNISKLVKFVLFSLFVITLLLLIISIGYRSNKKSNESKVISPPTINPSPSPYFFSFPTSSIDIPNSPSSLPTYQPTPVILKKDLQNTYIVKKVLVLDFNPVIEGQGKRLRELKGWNDPIILEKQFISSVEKASHGFLKYQIVKRISDIDLIPQKQDGFSYTDESYLDVIEGRTKEYRPDAPIDYSKILADYNVCEQRNREEIDELWLWGGPWFGYWEAVMTGPKAYFTNAPPIQGTACTKLLSIFGFSYERDEAVMLEDLGHRFEGTMTDIFQESILSGGQASTDWGKFTMIDKYYPKNAHCGYVHYPPNALSDYDWSNDTSVYSNCDEWLRFPDVKDKKELINCTKWNCNQRDYLIWWLTHIPHDLGETNGRLNNWWRYLITN